MTCIGPVLQRCVLGLTYHAEREWRVRSEHHRLLEPATGRLREGQDATSRHLGSRLPLYAERSLLSSAVERCEICAIRGRQGALHWSWRTLASRCGHDKLRAACRRLGHVSRFAFCVDLQDKSLDARIVHMSLSSSSPTSTPTSTSST